MKIDKSSRKSRHPPSYYEGIIDQFLYCASEIIEYGMRVVPEVTPAI